MAPERLEGKEADARTDLWALGAILYEMVTGQRAFEGASQVSLVGNIMNAEPAALSSLQPLTPPALERVVKKCLAKHPDDRWDTAHDVADELRWISQVSGAAADSRSVRGRGARVGVVIAGVLAGAALGAVVSNRCARQHPVMEARFDSRRTVVVSPSPLGPSPRARSGSTILIVGRPCR